jgi:hypothetical protein
MRAHLDKRGIVSICSIGSGPRNDGHYSDRLQGVQYFTNGDLKSNDYLYICTVIRTPPLSVLV